MSCNKCTNSCRGVEIPYYEDSCFQENQMEGIQVFNQYAPVIRISTEWAVPLAESTVTLKVAALSDTLTYTHLTLPTILHD